MRGRPAVNGTTPKNSTKTKPSAAPLGRLSASFERFHQANPLVLEVLLRLAREWVAQGGRRCGIALLLNVTRWELGLRTQSEDGFKLNDHHGAYYARLLMRIAPELEGLFELRRAPEADAWVATFGPANGVAP